METWRFREGKKDNKEQERLLIVACTSLKRMLHVHGLLSLSASASFWT